MSNLIERLVILSDRSRIELKDLQSGVIGAVNSSVSLLAHNNGLPLRKAIERLEAALIQDALLKTGTQDGAAKMLRVNQATIARKAKRYGITRSRIVLHNRESARQAS